MATDSTPINLFEFEEVARARLPKAEYDYIAGGATDEISVDRNRRASASWALRPRVRGAAPALAAGCERPGFVHHRSRHEAEATGFNPAVRWSQAGASRRRDRHLPGRGGVRHGPGRERQLQYFVRRFGQSRRWSALDTDVPVSR